VAEAARLVAPGGKLLIVDFAPHDLEFLRSEHRHRRLGFFDNEIERWAAAGGLGKLAAVTLPPAGPGGLTVKVWVAEHAAERIRRVA
jgi:ArsR family transcriptional regulator